MVDVIYSQSFQKTVKKIKNSALKNNVRKHIIKIINNPEIGKPLKYNLHNERTVYIKPFRIIYTYNAEAITFLVFEHRDIVYK